MFPSLKLSDIIVKWRDVLVKSQEIDDFCQNRYAKPIKIFIGLDAEHPPADQDCPYILIRLGKKMEGADKKVYRYVIPVEWGIRNNTKIEDSNLVELPGLYDSDELGQLILTVLSNAGGNCPISKVDYCKETVESFPQFVGRMEVKFYFNPALGGTLVY